MDSLTQIVLGSSIGAMAGGQKYGRKAALIGAICGTIPDMDILLFPVSDPIASFTYHRGFSHSILFALLATPILAWLFSKIKWLKTDFKDKQIHLIVFLGLLTHMLLDALTIYGTQLLWPLSFSPIGTGSIFIIDPLYTLPLIFGLTLFLTNKSTRSVKITLILSTLYLIWGLAIQHYIHSQFKNNYNAPYQQALIQTTPFNTILWRILVIKEDSYEVGYYSIFDKDKNIKFKNYSSLPELIKPISNSFAVTRLQWFTKGFYNVSIINNEIIMADLRMGLEPNNYIFSFIVGRKSKDKIFETPNQKYPKARNMSQLYTVWKRMWNENIEL